MTQPIPKPQLLDPDRVNRDAREEFSLNDHQNRGDLLSQALEESCAYAEQLWDQLDAVRSYLLDSLPPDPRRPGPHTSAAASPTGPDDEEGWQNWINAFSATTSVLCGSHGDSGFGLSRAREEAQLRRTAPELQLHADHPRLGEAEPDRPAGPSGGAAEQKHEPASTSGKWEPVKAVVGVMVAVLALRGLRRRPRPHGQ